MTELQLIGIAAFCLGVLAALALRYRRRQQEIFAQALSTQAHPIQILGPKEKVLYTNPACREWLGNDKRPIPVALLSRLEGNTKGRDQVTRLIESAQRGAPASNEIRLPLTFGPSVLGDDIGTGERKPSVSEWRRIAARPLLGRSGVVMWSADDVTTEHRLRQAALQDQAHVGELLGNAPVGFYTVDSEGRFLFINQTMADWLDLPVEALIADDTRLHNFIQGPLPDHTKPYDACGYGRGPDHGVTWVSAQGTETKAFVNQAIVRSENGAPVRVRALVHLNPAEQSSSISSIDSGAYAWQFFEDAPVGIVLMDEVGRLTKCNPAFSTLVGPTTGPLDGHLIQEFVEDSDRDAISKALASLADAGSPGASQTVELRLRGETGTSCSVFITSLTEKQGGAEKDGKILAYFIDSSEQKSLEAQVVQSQKMQAIGQLAGGIAHDFNNLLTAMIGFCDLLLLRHRPGDQSFGDIMQIKQNANRAANLVRQLLAFSRQQTLQPRNLSMTDILTELSHLLRRLIGENIDLKMVHGRDLGNVRADQGQLEQVIINLAVNARDAMPWGGKLVIRTANLKLERAVKQDGDTMPPGDYVVVEVTDTGCGISKENLDRIFEPFFSTKEVGAGTGLGLSTVYGIVRQTGGFVFVKSILNKGTTFSICLPQHELAEGEVPAAEAEKVESRDLTGAGTVLLVEDEDGVRSFSARALRNKGYDVLEARSGDAALEVMENHKEPIDLLITDVVMPRVDGPTLVRRVRQTRPDLKVIFISGYAEDAFRQKLGQDANIDFLAKPFSLKQLAVKVKEVMRDKCA